MVQSDAEPVDEYLASLDPERRAVIAAVRDVVVANLPTGYVEEMAWGMISYDVPLERYPTTYNGKPLMYAALASLKRYCSLYLTTVYADPARRESFESRYRASGKRLDMGKSCVRFRSLDDLPLDLVADVIGATSVDDFLASYEAARAR
jgi:Domain of unknown function (DU1801)